MRKIANCLILVVMMINLLLPVKVFAENADMPTLSEAEEYKMKKAWFTRFTPIQYGNPAILSVRYYGEYDGMYVVFIDKPSGYDTVVTEETVAGYTFVYPTTQRLLVYNGSGLRYVSEAFELGWLSEDAVGRLYDYYTNGVYVPDTGDTLLLPSVILLLSGTALAVLVLRKKKTF